MSAAPSLLKVTRLLTQVQLQVAAGTLLRRPPRPRAPRHWREGRGQWPSQPGGPLHVADTPGTPTPCPGPQPTVHGESRRPLCCESEVWVLDRLPPPAPAIEVTAAGSAGGVRAGGVPPPLRHTHPEDSLGNR